MMDDIFQRRTKKHVKDLNIVPILDMLVTVIFFLLMSTSFIEYTKVSLPPSATVTAASESKTPPVSPKLKVVQREQGYELHLLWGGARPGHAVMKATPQTLIEETRRLIEDFSKRYPSEKTLLVSMGRNVQYQTLISVMDGARDFLPDLVLSSYSEVDSL